MEPIKIVLVVGPTASGKSKEAVRIAKERNGEVISVDSRQVYRGLDIGTEKTSLEEMAGIPHHLIDIRDPADTYSAGDFVHDAKQLITEISARGALPILAGGTHFYVDALLYGLPEIEPNKDLRKELEKILSEDLYAEIKQKDPRRAEQLDPANRRRLIRAVEILRTTPGARVPARASLSASATSSEHTPSLQASVSSIEHALAHEYTTSPQAPYDIEWIIIDPPRDELRARIDARLAVALENGLIDEVMRVREHVGDTRLNELGLEYRIIGEFLRGERSEDSLLPTLSSRLWHYARRQKAWLRKLQTDQETFTTATEPPQDKN